VEQLLGQPQAVELLTQALRQERIAPAYLFHGADGVGKSLAARWWVEMVFTDRMPQTQQDIVRQKLRQGNHPDVLWVEPTYNDRGKLLSATEAAAAGVKKKAPPQIRIEQIRDIGRFLSRPPLLGGRSIVVIEDAQTMAEGAANALLKTLEEPGNATLILLATGLDLLLPTLISRCQQVPFYRLSESVVCEILAKLDRADIIANPEILGIAQGSVGAAINLAAQLQEIDRPLLDRACLRPTNLKQALALATEIDRELDSTQQLWLLDYLQYAYWQQERDSNLIKSIDSAKQHLLAYIQPRLVWECLLMQLVKSSN
jgi:DNA polymerase III subunit delta'